MRHTPCHPDLDFALTTDLVVELSLGALVGILLPLERLELALVRRGLLARLVLQVRVLLVQYEAAGLVFGFRFGVQLLKRITSEVEGKGEG